MLNIAFLHGLEIENERGEVDKFGWALTRPGPYTFPVSQGSKIKNQGEITVTVVFQQGTPTHDFEVVSQLSLFSKVALNVVDLLQDI